VYSLTRHVMAPEVFAMSRRSWEDLPASDREAVLASARASVPVMRTIWDRQVRESRQLVEAAGVTIVGDIDREAFTALMEPVWRQFAHTPELRSLLRSIRETGEARG